MPVSVRIELTRTDLPLCFGPTIKHDLGHPGPSPLKGLIQLALTTALISPSAGAGFLIKYAYTRLKKILLIL